jgi:CHC2 zinc finger
MNNANQARTRGHIRRDLLPNPREFYTSEGFHLRGNGPWVEAGKCPFHDDHAPSFRVNLETGRGRCMACGWSGDMLAFVQQRHHLGFVDAAKRLGAWEVLP